VPWNIAKAERRCRMGRFVITPDSRHPWQRAAAAVKKDSFFEVLGKQQTAYA
jgi:hypothetical protein